ncbi:MAG TPA: glycogen debranching N-terminal domain-containing protein [Actinomycetota bacterium]|nr:glycogen debranching N-terminal domain-containing protein [Actinomycetota bacterium]
MGRAGPVELKPAPQVSAEASEDLLVLKDGKLFICSREDGDISGGFTTGEGLYADDTRYLSEFHLTIGDKAPIFLSASTSRAFEAFIDLTNPDLRNGDDVTIPQMTLNIRRTRLVGDRLQERIRVRNHGSKRITSELALTFGADFADIFEIRGVRKRMSRGELVAPKPTRRGVTFTYIGEDEAFRQTILSFVEAPKSTSIEEGAVSAIWPLDLGPREAMTVVVTVETSLEGARLEPSTFEETESVVKAARSAWQEGLTSIQGHHRSFNRFVDASVRDLGALLTPAGEHEIIAAGIPWYAAPFGRDTLITCYEMLMLSTAPARDALLFLASRQATEDDPLRDAEPGKILHELRVGELARAGYIPHTPYYGTVDATPLYVMLAAAYYRWTGDIETMQTIKPALDAALRWIDEHGDLDGDGFVEYQRRSPAGLDNQGWKDSEDSIPHVDGTLAHGPIALVEVQAYVYLAKKRAAEIYDALGDETMATTLRNAAEKLKKEFNDAFWMPAEGTLALALDGDKRQVQSVTSNAGHALYCDIVDKERAALIAERLMAPDMFSGWGVRTLSSESVVYNPMSYHNGSVWPHDNAIIAAGLKRYGFRDATQQIAAALFDAAIQSSDYRLPELFCGFQRRSGAAWVRYPVACRPQAWAAAVPFMILQSMLGISPNAGARTLTIHQPHLPVWIDMLELKGLRVGASRLAVRFKRDGDATSFSLVQREGDVRLTIEE